MDSMRSLNRSLPHSTSAQPLPPEQLLQAFKSAALSVTNLYKTAVTDQQSSRQAGYQDALDDLLSFMDKENIGVQDGEGWTIRQWATERFDRVNTGSQQVESDDDKGDQEKRARSSSPRVQRKQDSESDLEASRAISPVRNESAPPQTSPHHHHQGTERPTVFTFTAAQELPTPDTQMQNSEATTSPLPENEQHSQLPDAMPVRVEALSRASRAAYRHAGSRHNTRSLNRDFNVAVGTKRKFNIPDFFDISNVSCGKDGLGGGGGKRGRYV